MCPEIIIIKKATIAATFATVPIKSTNAYLKSCIIGIGSLGDDDIDYNNIKQYDYNSRIKALSRTSLVYFIVIN